MICRRKNFSGMILIVVLWVMVAISTICMALAISSRGHLQIAHDKKRVIGEQLALASILNKAQAVLESDSTSYDGPGDIWNVPLEANFTVSLDDCAAILFAVDSDGAVNFGLIDETAKINANTASAELLARLPGMNISTATAFVDLRGQLASALAADLPDMPQMQPRGACGPISSYRQLSQMLATALGQNFSLGRDLRTMDPSIRFKNPLDLPDDVAKLIALLSVNSRSRNCRLDGSDRININTASINDLTAALGDVLDSMEIEAIFTSAADSAFSDPAELLTRNLTYTVNDGPPQSISIDNTKFAAIEDRLCCDDKLFHIGLININTAAPEVIMALEGITDTIAGEIINRRQSSPVGLQSKSWLLEILDPIAYAAISPLLTTKSQQFSAMAVVSDSRKAGAIYARCVFQRDMGESSVISVERYTGIWHDPR